MARGRRGGRPGGPRGPYRSDILDPNELGSGGIRVRQHRHKKQWTIEVLAERANLSTGTISGIEKGTLGYGPETLQKLAIALGTTIPGLFLPPHTRDDSEFLQLLERADDAEFQRITDFARGVVSRRRS